MGYQIQKNIYELLKQVVKTEETIEPTTDLVQLGLDSIGLIKFLLLLETEFDIEIEDEDLILSNWLTPEHILNMLNKYFHS